MLSSARDQKEEGLSHFLGVTMMIKFDEYIFLENYKMKNVKF